MPGWGRCARPVTILGLCAAVAIIARPASLQSSPLAFLAPASPARACEAAQEDGRAHVWPVRPRGWRLPPMRPPNQLPSCRFRRAAGAATACAPDVRAMGTARCRWFCGSAELVGPRCWGRG